VGCGWLRLPAGNLAAGVELGFRLMLELSLYLRIDSNALLISLVYCSDDSDSSDFDSKGRTGRNIRNPLNQQACPLEWVMDTWMAMDSMPLTGHNFYIRRICIGLSKARLIKNTHSTSFSSLSCNYSL